MISFCMAERMLIVNRIGGRSLFDDIILVMCGLSVTIAGIGLGVAVMAGAMTGAAAWVSFSHSTNTQQFKIPTIQGTLYLQKYYSLDLGKLQELLHW